MAIPLEKETNFSITWKKKEGDDVLKNEVLGYYTLEG